MDRRSLGYSALLLFGLIIASVFLNRGLIEGLHSDADVSLTRDASTYLLGQTIVFNGTLTLPEGEATTSISSVRLVTTGPQPIDIFLPVEPTVGSGPADSQGFVDISHQTATTDDIIKVKVVFTNVQTISSGVLPGGALPGTLPGLGDFKGVSGAGTIAYEVHWTPPVFLDPAPTFTLITNAPPDQTDVEFQIPLLAGEAAVTGTILPQTAQLFQIPTVGQPAGTVLPNVTSTFSIPQVTVTTNATTSMPDLPNTDFTTLGFNIPTFPVTAAPGGERSFPDSTAGFDIPTATTTAAPSGVPDLPEFVAAFTITNSEIPRGVATDGTDFWVISDNTGSGSTDRILRFTSAGAATGTPILSPTSDLEGIAFLNNKLWIVENRFRCFDPIDSTRCDRGHRVFELDPASPPAGTEAAWGALTNFAAPDTFESIGGITAEGGGSSGTLWLAAEFGFRFYNLSQTGSEIDSPFTDSFIDGMDGLAISGAFLYTSKGQKITQWTKQGARVQEFSAIVDDANPNTQTGAAISGIRGMTFKAIEAKEVLFIGSSDGKVYKGFFAENVTTNPKGLAFSPSSASVGEALWIVVDGSPKDKILKVATSTGALITTFGTTGAADAPSKNIDGMTFLSGSLWLVGKDGGQRKLYKVNPANGSLTTTFDLETTAQIFDDIGGITNDGTNLVLHTKTFNDLFVLDTNGLRTGIGQAFPCCPTLSGAKALAFNSRLSQFFAASGNTVVKYNDNFNLVGESNITQSDPSSVSISDIQGMAFSGDLLFFAHSDTNKISKSFLATTVTKKPRGLAFTTSDTTPGRALWILVDGDPVDKLLKVDADTGALITSFGTNGGVDAPSKFTEGVTFLNTGTPSTSFLWIAANEDFSAKVFKVNPTTGALVTTFNLQNTANVFGQVGGITNDGTNLIVHDDDNNDVSVIDPFDGSSVQTSFPCCPSGFTFGATGLTRHAGRGQLFTAKNNSLLTLDSSLQQIISDRTVTIEGSGLSTGVGIEGMVFDQDVLYLAILDGSNSRITVGALRVTAGTKPKGLAFSTESSSLSGAPIGKALWVLVDGDPKDKLLKLNPDNGQLITTSNFPSSQNDVGFVDAPSKQTDGITFLDGHLWIIANESFEHRLFKVKATDGSLVQTFNLSGFPSGFVFDDIGGITNDGTNLQVFNSSFDQMIVIDTLGQKVEDTHFCCNTPEGSEAAARRVGTDQVLTARGSEIRQFTLKGSNLHFVNKFNVVDENSNPLGDIQALTFDLASSNNVTDDVLYVADFSSGKIATTGVPSDVTNSPRGLAYDPGANELYILVDGKGSAPDHVVVVDPNSTSSPPTPIRDFDAPEGDTHAITFLSGSLYVSLTGKSFGGPPPKDIVRLSPTDGAEQARFSIDFLPGDSAAGLSNDGTSLLITPKHGGPHAVFLDPSTGSELDTVRFFDPKSNFFEEGFQGLAFSTTTQEFFPVKFKDVFQFDQDGENIDSFTVATAGFSTIRGAVLIGNVLHLAEGQGNTIHTTKVPLPASAPSRNPLGMGIDNAGSLYVAVDFGPEDKIMKLSTSTPGSLDTSFGDQGSIDTGSAEIQAVAIHGDSLYAISNELETFEEEGFFLQFTVPIVREFDKNTGAKIRQFGIFVQGGFGPPPFGCGFPAPGDTAPPGPNCKVISQTTMGALVSDGNFLYAGAQQLVDGEGAWFKLDVDNPSQLFGFPVLNGEKVTEDEGLLPLMPGFEAMQIIISPEFAANRQLLGANGDTIARFDRSTGVMFRERPAAGVVSGQFKLSGTDIKGLAYTTSTRKLFIADDASDNILSTTLPENTGVELTVVGSYGTQLLVSADTPVQDTTATYSIIRNPEVLLDLQSPADGFVFTQVSTTISGRINDPSIATTTVGITLPFAKFVDDPVTSGVSEGVWTASGDGANWHIACQGGTPKGFPGPTRFSSAACSWRYGVPDGLSFDTGSATQGSLTLKTENAVLASNDTQLKFFTGYDTEVPEDIDVKLVEVATVTTDLQGNDVVGSFRPVAQIVLSSNGGQIVKPANFHPSFQFIELDSLFVNPNLVPVAIDLSAFENQRIVIRFNFDSIDNFGNEGEGWYLDDIEVSGSGVKTIQIATTRIDPPETGTVNGTSTTFFRRFSAPFTLSEGLNTVGAQATQPYGPFLSDLRTVSGFVDTQTPVVSLFGIDPAVSGLGQTLSGSLVEPTLVSLKIVHTIPGGATSTIFTLSSEPQGGTFSVGVTLKEGKNTFTALVVDGGGLTGSTSLNVIADTSAPSISDDGAIFPVGAVSARAGDEIVFQVTASDGSGDTSGVQKVELVVNGQVQDTLDRTDQLPDIVVDKFGISGNFVLFTSVPQGIPPGQFSITVRATDNAGNTSETTVSGDVTASLRSQNIFLFEGANLVGVTLQYTRTSDRAFPIADVLAQALDTTRLESSFATNLSANLGNTSDTGSSAIAGGSTVTVLDISNFNASDRIALGTGDTTLTANAASGASTISVAATSGFSAGQTIVISGDQGPFGLGFANGSATATIASIATSTINLASPLSTTHFLGARVTGIQTARIASTSGNQITIDGTFVVQPAAGAPVVEQAKLGDIVEAIWFFTGGDTGQWQSFTPASGGGLLAKLNQGRGYWFITKTQAFDRSAPLPGFLEGPVIPVTMQLDGVLFDPSGVTPSLPATVQLAEAGWHLIALIGEQSRPVERGVRGVLFPTRQFNSLIEFQKFIDFDPTTDGVEIVGGVFNPLFAGDIANPGDTMEIGRGFYIFMNQAGTHTP